MRMTDIIGQHLFIGISGHSLTHEEKDFIVNNNIGGICLFGRNVSSPEQVYDLCQEIQALHHNQPSRLPIFIGIDMEGGRVHRLKSPFTQWPALKCLGDIDNPTLTFHFAQRMGQELRAVGINLDFAPCIDVYTNPLNTVIGDRALSSDPEKVSKHASALVRGYIKADILTCAKHFPGHGNTLIDSHEDLPVEEISFEDLENRELVPFKKSFKSKVDMVMTSHIHFPQIDPQWPTTLSPKMIHLIREEYRYKGLIITDDMGMKAMTKHYGVTEAPIQALLAGVDLLLYCNEPEVPPQVIEGLLEATAQGRITHERLLESYARIADLKSQKLQDVNTISKSDIPLWVGTEQNLELASAIRGGGAPAWMQNQSES